MQFIEYCNYYKHLSSINTVSSYKDPPDIFTYS